MHPGKLKGSDGGRFGRRPKRLAGVGRNLVLRRIGRAGLLGNRAVVPAGLASSTPAALQLASNLLRYPSAFFRQPPSRGIEFLSVHQAERSECLHSTMRDLLALEIVWTVEAHDFDHERMCSLFSETLPGPERTVPGWQAPGSRAFV